MKKMFKFAGFFVLAAVIGLVMTSCVGLLWGGYYSNNVAIRSDGNLSSVLAGGTLRFTATGRNIIWAVSSTSDGSGPVAERTGISANGLLMAADDETNTLIYVIATSADSGQSEYKPIRIVSVTGVSVSPSNQSVTTGKTLQFRADVTGNNDPDGAVTWRVSSNSAGTGAVTQGTTIDANGLLTVALRETLTTLFVTANSVVDPSKSNSAAVTIIIPIVTGVAVNPANQSVTTGRTLQFNASVTGINNPSNAVTWQVSSNTAGYGAVASGTRISASGLLTVAVNEKSSTLFVIATSDADPSKSSSVIVNIIIPTVTGVAVSPANQSVQRGRTLQFNASVTGSNNPSNAVTWRVSSNAAGSGSVASGTSINANGLLNISANETSAALFVIATSSADTSKSGSVIVNVIIPTVNAVSVSPANQSVERGKTLQFRASVTGSNNPSSAVRWRVGSNASGSGAVTSGTGINANGLLTISANETASTLFIVATSAVDTSKSGSAMVTVIVNNNNQRQNGQNRNQRDQNQNSQGQNRNSRGQNQNSQGQNQNSQGQNQNSQGQDQNSQGQNQNSQGQNQNSQGQNQNSQGQNQNSQGQNQNSQGQNQQ